MASDDAQPSPIIRPPSVHQMLEQHFQLPALLPGTYEFQIMAVSLAGNGSWTTPKNFTIPSREEALSFSGDITYYSEPVSL
ncbi:unnamed protein product [Protopolystoma xenopodis]|uniref:Fibronectin type-III domain-containing protein n=1 Tax=Protopolystoma xenopodis TaxID=117903 RepID=A0A3S5CF13_9PLAT|nr:unnamed protein product [Protopolystoma xenopodis]